jgi:hypothetical protein
MIDADGVGAAAPDGDVALVGQWMRAEQAGAADQEAQRGLTTLCRLFDGLIVDRFGAQAFILPTSCSMTERSVRRLHSRTFFK